MNTNPLSSRRLALTLLGVSLLPQSVTAALKFEQKEIPVSTTAVADSVNGTVSFVNAGTRTIKLKSVQPSCSCTTATTDKKEYAPGETGVLKYQVTVGQKTGRDFASIRVTTDEPGDDQYILIDLTIAPLATFQQTRILWREGEPLAERTVLITSLVPEAIRISNTTNGRKDLLKLSIREVEPGKQYALVIQPVGMRRPFDDRIDVVVAVGDKVFKNHTLYARAD